MKLPIPFIKSKQSKNEYYLALLLDDEKIGSVILEETLGNVKIVGKHEESLPSPLETISQDELIAIVDKTISRAEEVLPPNIETHKTVFGVKESWVEKETKKIKKDYLAKLKKICDALSLSPIGFMVISEAIANLLQTEEGSPLSAILVELGRKTVHVTLFRGGQISESTSGYLEHSAQVTVDTLLKKFTAPVLPTKILLTHTKDTKNVAQQFLHHEWSKSLPFLHVPQVKVLPEDLDAKAVAFGAAHQMGFEILGLEKSNTHEKKIDTGEPNIIPEDIPTPIPSGAPISGNDFGFVPNQDISEIIPDDNPKVDHGKTIPPEPMEAEKNDSIVEDEDPPHVNLRHEKEDVAPDDNHPDPDPSSGKKKKNIFSGLFASIPPITFPKNLKIPEFLKKNKGLKLAALITGGILILGIGFYIFYLNNVKAEVILSLKPNEVEQVENITFSTNADNDFSKNIIAAKNVSVEVDGEISTAATGKKDAGEKAKGTVTVFNSSNRETTLSSGTAIVSSNNITFTLDKDVKLASASGDIFTGTKPGTGQVSVTAKEIGTESNLPSNARFAVGGNNTLAAKNDSAFSGGTKKTITVVSKTDIEKLRKDLPKNLEKKAIEELSSKGKGGETVLPGFVKTSIADEDFDKDIDDEAKQVKLKGTVEYIGMSYQNSDLENFDESILKDKFSDEIILAKGSLKNKVNNTKVNNEEEIEASLSITAGLLPKINSQEVANKLKDKSTKDAKEILGTLPQVVDSQIKYSPNIFFLSSLFPRLPKNINVIVKAD